MLRVAARAEVISLVVLLTNLATVHRPEVSSLTGPLHGCAYLFVIVAAAREPGRSTATTLLSLVPGVGGLLTARRLRSAVPEEGTRPPGRGPTGTTAWGSRGQALRGDEPSSTEEARANEPMSEEMRRWAGP